MRKSPNIQTSRASAPFRKPAPLHRALRAFVTVALALAASIQVYATVVIPTQLEPDATDTIYSPFPRFFWEGHPEGFSPTGNAVFYRIQISTTANFSNVVDDDITYIQRYVSAEPLAPSQYYWRVKARVSGQAWSGWSAIQNFTITAPASTVTIPATSNETQFLNLITSALNATDGVILNIENGTYTFVSETMTYLFDFVDQSNITIQGNGSTLKFEERKHGLLRTKGCTDIAVSSLKIDYAKVDTEVRAKLLDDAEDIDGTNGRIKIILLAGSPTYGRPEVKAAASEFIPIDPVEFGRVKTGPRHYLASGNKADYVSDGGRKYTVPVIADATAFADLNRQDLLIQRLDGNSSHTTTFSSSTRVTLHDITTFSAPDVLSSSVEGTELAYLKCEALPAPGKWMSSTRGGFIIRSEGVGPWIEGCNLTNLGDDAIAFYSRDIRVFEWRTSGTSNRAVCGGDHFNLQVDDAVSFFDPATGNIILETTVAWVSPEANGRYEVAFDAALPFLGSSSTLSTSGTDADFDESAIQIWNRSTSNGDFVIRGNTFENIRRYANVFRAARGAIWDNDYIGISRHAITCINEPTIPNGLYASDLLIRNNTFQETGFAPNNNPPAISLKFIDLNGMASSYGPRNVLIEGNTFINVPPTEVEFISSQSSRVRNNTASETTGSGTISRPVNTNVVNSINITGNNIQ